MLLTVSIILTGVLLAVIVYGLHSYQRRETEDTVDRIVSLPPLDVERSMLDSLNETDAMGSEHLRPQAVSPVVSPEAAENTGDWLDSARKLAHTGNIEEAQCVCKEKYPQMGAFKQVAVILRRHIRDLKRTNHDIDESLRQLYEVAAAADYWHGKHEGLTRPAPGILKRVSIEDWQALPFPYQQIGYANLSLLTRGDVDSMVAAWGEPARHTPVRQYHEQHWEMLLKKHESDGQV